MAAQAGSDERLSGDFWRFWSAAALSNLGDGIRITALPLLAASLTREPLAISLVTAASLLPWLLGPLGGALVDRGNRKRLMVLGQLARGSAVATLALLAGSGHASLAAIYLVGLAVGAGEVIVDSASQAAIPLLAPRALLDRANSRLITVEIVTNDLVGGPLGAFLFALAVAAPFGVDAATFLIGGALVALVRRPLERERAPQAPVTLRADVREGLAFVWRHPLLRPLATAILFTNIAFAGAGSLTVLLALQDLGLSEVGYGLLYGTGALGGVAGSLGADALARAVGRGPLMIATIVVMAISTGALGLAPDPISAALALAIGLAAVSSFNVIGRTARQRAAPDHLLGRVVAGFRLIGMAGVPIGAVLAGAVASATSVRTAYVAAVVPGLAATFWVVRGVRHLPPERPETG